MTDFYTAEDSFEANQEDRELPERLADLDAFYESWAQENVDVVERLDELLKKFGCEKNDLTLPKKLIELANYAVKMEVRTLYREEPLEDVMGFFRDRDLGILKGPDGTWLTHDDLIARLEPVVCDMAQLQDLLATMRGTLQGDPPDFLVAKPSPCAVLSGVVDEPSLKKNACLYRQVGVKERSPTGPGIPFARAMLLFMSLFLLPSTVYGLTLADGMPYILYQAVMVNVPVGKNPVMMMPLVNLLYMWGPYHTLMMLSILLLNLGLPKDVRKNELLFTTDDPHFQPTYFQPKRSFFKGKQVTGAKRLLAAILCFRGEDDADVFRAVAQAEDVCVTPLDDPVTKPNLANKNRKLFFRAPKLTEGPMGYSVTYAATHATNGKKRKNADQAGEESSSSDEPVSDDDDDAQAEASPPKKPCTAPRPPATTVRGHPVISYPCPNCGPKSKFEVHVYPAAVYPAGFFMLCKECTFKACSSEAKAAAAAAGIQLPQHPQQPQPQQPQQTPPAPQQPQPQQTPPAPQQPQPQQTPPAPQQPQQQPQQPQQPQQTPPAPQQQQPQQPQPQQTPPAPQQPQQPPPQTPTAVAPAASRTYVLRDAVDVESIVSAVTDAKYEDLVIVHGPSLRRYGVTFPNHSPTPEDKDAMKAMCAELKALAEQEGIGKPVYMDLVTNMCQLRIDRRLLVQAKDLCNAGLDKAVDLVADLARKVAELETKVHADLSACLDRRQAYSIPWLLHRANSLLVAANATYLARVHHLALLPSELRPPLQHLAGQAAGGDLSRIQEAMKNELQAQDFMRQAVTGIYIVMAFKDA